MSKKQPKFDLKSFLKATEDDELDETFSESDETVPGEDPNEPFFQKERLLKLLFLAVIGILAVLFIIGSIRGNLADSKIKETATENPLSTLSTTENGGAGNTEPQTTVATNEEMQTTVLGFIEAYYTSNSLHTQTLQEKIKGFCTSKYMSSFAPATGGAGEQTSGGFSSGVFTTKAEAIKIYQSLKEETKCIVVFDYVTEAGGTHNTVSKMVEVELKYSDENNKWLIDDVLADVQYQIVG